MYTFTMLLMMTLILRYTDINMVILGGLHSGAGDPIGDYEIRDRIKTGTSAAWVQDGVAAVTAGTKTLSITNILQELVNMGTWSSVSAVSLMWVPNGTGTAKQFWFRDWNWDGPGGRRNPWLSSPHTQNKLHCVFRN